MDAPRGLSAPSLQVSSALAWFLCSSGRAHSCLRLMGEGAKDTGLLRLLWERRPLEAELGSRRAPFQPALPVHPLLPGLGGQEAEVEDLGSPQAAAVSRVLLSANSWSIRSPQSWKQNSTPKAQMGA